MSFSADIAAADAITLLQQWLAPRLSNDQRQWLDEQMAHVQSDPGCALAPAIGLSPRRLGKSDLRLTAAEMRASDQARLGLDASRWRVDQTARVLLVLASYDGNDAALVERLMRLYRSADLGEQVALLQGLPLYPAATMLVAIACEGVRSAMLPVFEAVAHRNPYPNERFDEDQWNQMVVKALFIGSTLAPIEGLDARRNPALASMLIDYVHERWAAGRDVSPELWRCVGPFATTDVVADLAKVLREGNDVESAAAALALTESTHPDAAIALKGAPALSSSIRTGEVTWDQIA